MLVISEMNDETRYWLAAVTLWIQLPWLLILGIFHGEFGVIGPLVFVDTLTATAVCMAVLHLVRRKMRLRAEKLLQATDTK